MRIHGAGVRHAARAVAACLARSSEQLGAARMLLAGMACSPSQRGLTLIHAL
jgi:hypothetical protein